MTFQDSGDPQSLHRPLPFSSQTSWGEQCPAPPRHPHAQSLRAAFLSRLPAAQPAAGTPQEPPPPQRTAAWPSVLAPRTAGV